MLKNKKKDIYIIYALWIILLLWRIPFLNKGIDYTDTGFSLTNYKNVFYGNGITDIGLFLTTFLGGVVYKILPAYQLLAFRVMYWLMYAAVDIITYHFFKRYLKPTVILLALLILNFGSKSGEALFSYYPFTKLLLIPAICLLISGITKKSNKAIAFSGLLCGVNVFVRLPNILFCSMILGIICYGIWTGEEKKAYWKRALIYFVSAFSGFLLVLIVILLYMGPAKTLNSFIEYVNLALGKTGTEVVNFLGIEEITGHSVFANVRTVAIQSVYALEDVILFGIPLLIVSVVISMVWKKYVKTSRKSMYLVIAMLEGLSVFALREQIYPNAAVLSAILVILVSLFLFVAGKKTDTEHRLIYMLTLLLAVCCVFGSDLGLKRVSILQGFVLLVIILGTKDIAKELHSGKQIRFYRYIVEPSISLFLLSLLVVNISVSIPAVYMDEPVGNLKFTVNEEIKVLNGMHTSEVRAREINEYYETLNRYSEYEVAVFGYFPLGYVITPQRDFFESVQPCVDYPGVSVESLLAAIQQKEETYPILVMSHVNSLQRGDDHDTSVAKNAVFDYMLTRTDYKCITNDQYFTIYVPTDSEKTASE